MKEICDQPDWVQRIHQLNDILHREPIASFAYGFYWYFILLVACPILAIGSVLNGCVQSLGFLLWHRRILPKDCPDKELAVVVTGCDTGFGQELVFSLVSKGFVVFPACLQKDSFAQFQGDPKIIPLHVDVTKDHDVDEAFKVVDKWIKEAAADGGKQKRCLHALVNNAGIGPVGLFDWMKLSDYQSTMDVNFFGTLRCVKAFLPILKKQAAEEVHKDARIINMISSAGLFSGSIVGSAYECSKFAVEAFTTNLRQEMKPFGIKVTSVNPGLHRTPLANGQNMGSRMRKAWDQLTPEHRDEYGNEFFNELVGIFEGSSGKFSWDKRHVVEAMDEAVVAVNPPPRILVGIDAKFSMYPLSKLPTSWRINFIRQKPKMMTQQQ